jgi:predicted cupin superfamily sugar epimerase
MDRATHLIDTLELDPHPEGGYYREIFRSRANVTPADDRGQRSAVTSIYFLLAGGEYSSWHVVSSDEVWHHLEGGPVELLTLDPATVAPQRMVLGSLADGGQPARIVPAGQWQAARPLGPYALVGCCVAPGFEFADFTLLRDDPEARQRVIDLAPDMAPLL